MTPRAGLLALAAAAALAVVAAVFLLAVEREPQPEEPDPEAEILHVELQQVADPTVFGIARLEELDGGRTRVSVEVVPPPVGEQAARIGSGECALPSETVHALEPVVGLPEAGEPGGSETVLDVPLGELVDAGHVLEVDTLTPEDELALCARLERRQR